MTSTPTVPPPSRTRSAGSPPSSKAAPRSAVSFGTIPDHPGHRIVLYGPGGIGKTTLAVTAPGPVAFFDLDESLPRLRRSFEESGLKLDVRVVPGVQTWQALRDALHAPGWDEIRTIVIDSATYAEELATQHVFATVPHPKSNKRVERLEDYDYGKGYQYLYEVFLTLLGDLDQHTRAGRHVILICHDCTNTVPNPAGADWLRYEPRLYCSTSGKAAIRLRVREWADHVLFLGYDVDVDKEGKGRGTGTRTIYPVELPHCMAKSRTMAETLPLTRFDTSLWTQLLK